MTSITIQPYDAPITESDVFLEQAVRAASTPALMMALIHVSGDKSLLGGRIRPSKAMMNEIQSSMSDEDRAEIARLAVRVLGEYRDRGCTLPPPPARETIREMMSFIVGEQVPAEYVPMMLEEIALDGTDPRSIRWEAGSAARARRRTSTSS